MLPRFQRHEAWSHGDVTRLLESVIQDLPIGSALVLDIGDTAPFISRTIEGAPQASARTTEHLLDGQQRITALWRSLQDSYADRKYFLEQRPNGQWGVKSASRYMKGTQLYPLWVDDQQQQYSRKLIPLSIMDIDTGSNAIREWCDAANVGREEERAIGDLRAQIANHNFPFLSLPVSTPKEVAHRCFRSS